MSIPGGARLLAFVTLACGLCGTPVEAQQLSKLDRERGRVMLRTVRTDLERHYYDTTYRGIDLAARFAAAEQRIDSAKSNSELFGIIGQVLIDLDDSHTIFWPPDRAARVKYGWEIMPIGDSVYVVGLKPRTHAAESGLRVGDRLISVNGYEPTKRNLWKLRYLLEILRPQVALRVIAEDSSGASRAVVVKAEVLEGKARMDITSESDLRDLYLDYSDAVSALQEVRDHEVGEILIYKLASFMIPPGDVDAIMRKARRFRGLVIDLRGNPGGFVVTMKRAVEHMIDREIIIYTGRTRTDADTVKARPVRDPYRGRLVVIVDSRSASASEAFARVMQIETRGTVIGDRTSGSLTTAMGFPHRAGVGRLVFFGASIAINDVVMSDGHRVEGVGVMPDEEIFPTPGDLATGRDRVLSRAVAIAGASITPEEAGRLFPFRWPK